MCVDGEDEFVLDFVASVSRLTIILALLVHGPISTPSLIVYVAMAPIGDMWAG
jgi:hypothetical protein